MACLCQEGGITGIVFCHETGGPKTGLSYKQEGLYPGLYSIPL